MYPRTIILVASSIFAFNVAAAPVAVPVAAPVAAPVADPVAAPGANTIAPLTVRQSYGYDVSYSGIGIQLIAANPFQSGNDGAFKKRQSYGYDVSCPSIEIQSFTANLSQSGNDGAFKKETIVWLRRKLPKP